MNLVLKHIKYISFFRVPSMILDPYQGRKFIIVIVIVIVIVIIIIIIIIIIIKFIKLLSIWSNVKKVKIQCILGGFHLLSWPGILKDG